VITEKGTGVKPEIAFGQVLREERKKAGLSQEKLASESNLDRTYISLLERGLRQPSLSSIIQISKALNISAVRIISQVEALLDENPTD
jgi:transcriptional regulator with XRE-family HTH domain